MRQNTWLHNWLEEFELTSNEDVQAALSDSTKWDRLIEHASRHEDESAPTFNRRSIVAGRSLDLTGFLGCAHRDCLKRQLDTLFSHVWHYFDKIAVVGADAHTFLEMVELTPPQGRIYIAGIAGAIFHARASGAEDYLVYVEKPPACAVHWEEYRNFTDLHLPRREFLAMGAHLLRRGKFGSQVNDGRQLVTFQNKDLVNGIESEDLARLEKGRKRDEAVETTLLRRLIQRYELAAASDLYAAEDLDLPIGTGVPLQAKMLSALRPTATESEIAFQLELPVFTGLSLRELLAIRESEGDAFEAFRLGLAQAMRSRLKEDGSRDPIKIAADIEDELLAPAIVEINRRLAGVEKTLFGKHAIHGGVIGLATMCGLLGAAPAATALTLGALASMTRAELKAVEEKTEVEASNMYFLWKVDHEAKRRNS